MKHEIVFPLPSTLARDPAAKALRFFTLGETRCLDSAILFNGGPCYSTAYSDKLWVIHVPCGNFSHCLGILWARNESDALDCAADGGLLDSEQVSEEDQAKWEAQNPGEDNEAWTRLGNASEPFVLADASLVEIPAAVWRADWEFVHACGRAAGGENLKTAADL